MCIRFFSTIPASIRDKAIEGRSPGEKRKIVVSSNLAETSLTVKGVRYVVDSGLICQSEWDPSIASGSFPTKPHSQSGVRQRWGRVGPRRTRVGLPPVHRRAVPFASEEHAGRVQPRRTSRSSV